MTSPPAQHMDALATAYERRLEKARIRREIAALPMREGLVALADMLDDGPCPGLGCARIADALTFVRAVGLREAERMLHRAERFPPSATTLVRDLTERQRRVIAAALRRRAGAAPRRELEPWRQAA